MVKVVGRDESAVKQTTCRICAAILEYVGAEVKNFTSYDYGGGSDIAYYVDCPQCHEKVYVKGY